MTLMEPSSCLEDVKVLYSCCTVFSSLPDAALPVLVNNQFFFAELREEHA